MDIKLEIIKLVEKYDCLYNAQSPQNKNFVYKQYLWNEIGKQLGISGENVKKEFKTVRDNYKKWQNKRLKVNGFQKQYKYAEYLGFLDDHMAFRSEPDRASGFIRDVANNSDASSDLDLFQIRTDLRLKVIEKVRQHDCLYNMYSPQYNNFDYNQQLWNQFEDDLSISAEQIKNIWENLRDDYIKYKQNPYGKYKYAENLNFLDDFILPESAPSNETFIISFIDDDNDDEINLGSANNSDLLVELRTDINVKIIEAVKNYDCLYNFNSVQNKDYEYKKEIWNQIGKEVGITGELVKRRWKSIKDYYRKCKLSTGTKYKYEEYLTFLDDYIVAQSKPIDESISLIDEEIVSESSNDAELLDINLDVHIKIFEAVKRYDCLYNSQSPQYKNFEYKQELWNQIANEVDMSVKTVRKKWQYLKDYYIKYKQNRMKSYKYAEHLKFLDNFINLQSYEEISTDLNLKIIEEVKNYKCLYDTQSVHYKDYELRQQLWYKIGKKLGIPAESVKGKWKHVKDYYRRCKEISNSNYKYAENLKFLDDYLIVMQSKGIHESNPLPYEQKATDLSNSLDVKENHTDVSVNLIEAVKKYDCLYNVQSPKYKDVKYKQKIWNKIGKEVGRSKQHVKKKWNNLVYRFKKCKEKMLSEAGSFKQYKYMEYLKFLDDNIIFQRDDPNSYQVLADTEAYTDLSNDSDIFYTPPVKKKKEYFEDSPAKKQDSLWTPMSTENMYKIENPKSSSNQFLENSNSQNSLEEVQSFLEKPVSIKKENVTRSAIEEEEIFSEEPISTNNFENLNSVEEIQDFSKNPILIKKENACQLLEKENFAQPLDGKQDILEEPISTKTLNRMNYPKSSASSTSQWFELLAKKINESNITAEQKNDIEFAVSSIVYSKLAEYGKQS